MKPNESVSNIFTALNYINLSKSYKSTKKRSDISISKIWDVILNPTEYNNEMRKLLNNPTFAEVFYKILHDENVVYQPKLIAASSDEILERVSNEFKIKIVKSNKDQGTCYLILTLQKEINLPLSNLYIICDNDMVSKKIPPLNNKQAQMIIRKEDKFYNLITNPESEIFLR